MTRCALLLLAASCTTTKVLVIPTDDEQIRAVNQVLSDRPAKVTFGEKGSVDATAVVVSDNQVQYVNEEKILQRVPLAAVSQIKYLSPDSPRGVAFGQGAGLGFVAGVAIGIVLASAGDRNDNSCQYGCFGPTIDQGTVVAAAAVALGVLGALVGGVIGAVYGHHEALEPGPKPPPLPACKPTWESPDVSTRLDCIP